MPQKQIESGIKRAVREFLTWNKWYVITVHGSPFGTRGISDLIAIRDRRVMFLEIKTDTGKLSADQLEFSRQTREHGGEYHIIRSVDSLTNLGIL